VTWFEPVSTEQSYQNMFSVVTGLRNFNPDLTRIVAQYLSHQDQLTLFVINHFHHDSSKLYRYIKLNSTNSKRYVDNEKFQERCLSLITSSSRQLGLNLESISDVSALGGVHTLDLSDCENISDVSALGGVHSLHLSGCPGISDVSSLGSVHTLNFKLL
jgi:hypothetical protein